MTRIRLSNRRRARTENITWRPGIGNDHKLIVSYGFDDAGMIKEAFVAGMRIESGINALANDACILYSRALQCGDDIFEISDTMTMNTEEGQLVGPPASIMGAIARRGAELQIEVNEGKVKLHDHENRTGDGGYRHGDRGDQSSGADCNRAAPPAIEETGGEKPQSGATETDTERKGV